MMTSAGARGNLLLALGGAVVASMPLWAMPYHVQLASTALIGGMFALSLQLLVGATGLVSLAHGAFFGLGSYAVYLLSKGLGGAPSVFLSLPGAMLLVDSFGNTTHLLFRNVERNPKLGADTFRFTPPKGADVLTE